VTAANEGRDDRRDWPAATGQVTRRLLWAPLRILALVTGVALIRGVLILAGRYLLGFGSTGTVRIEGRSLVLEVRRSILGRTIRESTTVVPIAGVAAVRIEDRRRYLHLLVGFGCLAIGAWIGAQWVVDGLRAGFPHLALLGAGVVAAGVLLDLLACFVVFRGHGQSHLALILGPWRLRLAGVEPRAAREVVEALRAAAAGEAGTLQRNGE